MGSESQNILLAFSNIAFGYDAPVLRDISFALEAGEILAILGPNGSGKTTLLKLAAGILKPAGGQVAILGNDITAMSRRQIARAIGYVAQESSIRFPLTAMEFVLQGRFAQGRLLGFESEHDVAEATRAMKLTETCQFASRLVGELSGGERQRVMLARALASGPSVLVLDEPVANLDISHQVKIMSLVRRSAAGRGMSAIVVTHELNLASEFATRVLMLKSGAILACGRPAQVMTEAALRELFEARLLVDVNPTTGAPRITLTDLCQQLLIGVAAAGKAVRICHCPATVMRNETDLQATASFIGGKASAQDASCVMALSQETRAAI